MLLRDAKKVLRTAAREAGGTVDFDDSDSIVAKFQLASDDECEIALHYVVRRGKGNAGAHVWAYVSIWAHRSFAEPDFEPEPAILQELPPSHRASIIRLRNEGVHVLAYLKPTGAFETDVCAFREEEELAGPNDQLRSDLAETLARARRLMPTMPAPDELAALLQRRKELRARLLQQLR